MEKAFRYTNPYLFFLAKRILGYEVEADHFFFGPPSDHAIDKFINLRREKENRRRYSTDYFRKEVLAPKNLDIPESMLDLLVGEIRLLGQFRSWQHFLTTYKNDLGAVVCEELYREKTFDELNESVKGQIHAWITQRMLGLHYQRLKQERAKGCHVIVSSEDYIIRSANPEEIEKVCSGAELQRFISIYPLNQNVIFVYRDNYKVWGHLTLLPLKYDIYQELKFGKKQVSQINRYDIHRADERSQVRCILIHSFKCDLKNLYFLFATHLQAIVTSLASVDKLTICCVTDKEGVVWLLKHLRFTKTKLPEKTASFYEIEWNDLQIILEREKELPPYMTVQLFGVGKF